MTNWAPLGRRFAYLNAALILAAAVLYGLTTFGVIGPEEPSLDGPRAADLERLFTFIRDQQPIATAGTILASLGFLCLVPVGLAIREVLGRPPIAQLASAMFVVGAILLTAAQMVQIGTGRALAELSSGTAPELGALQVVLDSTFHTVNWLENAGYFGLGVATLSTGLAVAQSGVFRVAWGRTSLVVGAAYLAVVAAQAFEAWTVYEMLLIVGGALLAPAWSVWLGRQLATPTGSR